MAKQITINTGVEEYELNGVSVSFNPTDLFMAEKIFSVFDSMDGLQTKWKAQVEAAGDDHSKIFQICRSIDQEMRKSINGLFGKGKDYATEILGNVALFSQSETGFPLWAEIVLPLMDEMDDSFAERREKSKARIEAYTAKYGKRDSDVV